MYRTARFSALPDPLLQLGNAIFGREDAGCKAEIVKRTLNRAHHVGPLVKLTCSLQPAVEVRELRF